jgi:hypothetical protein
VGIFHMVMNHWPISRPAERLSASATLQASPPCVAAVAVFQAGDRNSSSPAGTCTLS